MKTMPNAHFPVFVHSHAGMKGKQNEDRLSVSAYQLSQDDPRPVLLAVLCDGIGGHCAGEVAAEKAVETISAHIATSDDGLDPLAALEQSIQIASQSILAASHQDQGRSGMGATCACALIIERQLYTASVGDSRIYLLRNDELKQLTTDHTWVQEALEAGVITQAQAAGHPNAHVIRRYLGSGEPPEVDFRLRLNSKESDQAAINNQGLNLLPGDVVFLCSDGLTDLVNDLEIKNILKKMPLQAALEKLTDLANARGGHDNITQIAFQVPSRHLGHHWKALLLGGAFVLLLLLALIGSIYFGWIHINSFNPTQPVLTQAAPLIFPDSNGEISPAPSLMDSTPSGSPQTTPTDQNLTPEPTLTPWPTNTTYP